MPRWITGLATFVAVTAWGGALGLIIGFGTAPELNERLPFDSPVLGGLALMAVVAAPFSLIAALLWQRHERAVHATLLGGVLLIGWIAMQVAVLGEVNGLHLSITLIGIVLAGWASGKQVRAGTPSPS
jgi:hypothetical protein